MSACTAQWLCMCTLTHTHRHTDCTEQMPSSRWRVTVETNPGKDDASETSADAASAGAPTDLSWTNKQLHLHGKRGKKKGGHIEMLCKFSFFGFCLWIIKINRRGKTAELWWQGHTDTPQLPVGGASRDHSRVPVSLASTFFPFHICV